MLAWLSFCLERDADLHTAQLMPLPLTVSCFSKIQIGFAFLVPAHPGSPGKRAVKQMCVCVLRYAVMADFAKSTRSKRRKVKTLAEEHLRDIVAVSDDTLDEVNARCDESSVIMELHYNASFVNEVMVVDTAATEGHLSSGFIYVDDAGRDSFPDVGAACNSIAGISSTQQFVSDTFAIDDLSDGDLSDATISDEATSSDDCSSVVKQLAEWTTQFNISQAALSAVLQIFRSANVDVPKDARTVMNTPQTVSVSSVAGGSYFYFGIGSSIRSRMNDADELLCGSEVNLNINIDGLPLSRSSSVQFWPILGTLQEIKLSEPFVIAIYSGSKKPDSVHDFLKDFISEMKDLQKNQITVNGKSYSVNLAAIICDAPARSFVKCTKGHSGYNSCERCTQEGDYYDNRMTFPEMAAPARTDEQFASWNDKDHQPELSPLVSLGVGCVSQVPLDYMHLVCLGVVRRMIFLWIQGRPVKHRIGSNVVSQISEHLLSLRNDIPREFSRKPRSLIEVRNWKATEFRQFLLYTGPVVLAGKLPDRMYQCFMLLSVALTILLNETFCQSYCDYAEQLLTVFVKNFASMYGQSELVYNVHNLLHLAQDARRYGALDKISSFPFENYLGRLKKMARKPSQHVSQIVRRIVEREHAHQSTVWMSNPSKPHRKPHTSGPLPAKFANCCQYKQFVKPGCFISCTGKDNCFSLDGKTILIRNILTTPTEETLVVYEDFERSESVFSYPLQSSDIGINLVQNLSGRLSVANICNVGQKCVLLHHKSGFVAIPLLHLY